MQVIFIIVSAITLVSAVLVVTNRNLFHAAMYMIVSFLGVAGLYVLLEAGFMAATQLLVYIGAISILVIFAIMMTRRMMQTTETPYNSQWLWSGIGSLLLFAVLAMVVTQVTSLNPAGDSAIFGRSSSDPAVAQAISDSVVTLGLSFVDAEQYVLPFILASVLLLVALVGSIIVARPDVEEDEG